MLEAFRDFAVERRQMVADTLLASKLAKEEAVRYARESVAVGFLKDHGLSPLLGGPAGDVVRRDIEMVAKNLGVSTEEASRYIVDGLRLRNNSHAATAPTKRS